MQEPASFSILFLMDWQCLNNAWDCPRERSKFSKSLMKYGMQFVAMECAEDQSAVPSWYRWPSRGPNGGRSMEAKFGELDEVFHSSHIAIQFNMFNICWMMNSGFLWHQLPSVLPCAAVWSVCRRMRVCVWCILTFRNWATSMREAVLIGIFLQHSDRPHASPYASRWQATDQIFQAAKRTGQRDLSDFLSWNFLGLGDSKDPKVTRVMAYHVTTSKL